MDESNFPKSRIAGVQTVIPAEVTQHRKVRPISVGDPAGAGIFRRTLNIVLYYKYRNGDADSGWLVAGWIKESLGRALAEKPMLCGRLRSRREEEDGGLEVMANDSGVRLVEAKIPANLPEFVELVKRDKLAKAEAQTLFWRDIDEDDPQFSPLFYVQVTNFECGGYSVGISCSILVADLLLGTDFLRKWSEIQTSILMHQTMNHEASKTPIFYLPALKQDLGHLSDLSSSASAHIHEKPSIFRAESTSSGAETWEKIALICAGKAVGEELGRRTSPVDVFLFVKERGDDDGGTKVEVRRSGNEEAKEINNNNGDGSDVETRFLSLEELGLSEVRFWQGKRAYHSSCKVGSVSDGFVLVVPSAWDADNSTAKVIVAKPPHIKIQFQNPTQTQNHKC